MGGTASKQVQPSAQRADSYDSASATTFVVVYEDRNGSTWSKQASISERWASKSLETALIEPMVSAYNAERRSRKDRINATDIGWVEIGGKIADPTIPLKSFGQHAGAARDAVDGDAVEVLISRAPDSCASNISLSEKQPLATKLTTSTGSEGGCRRRSNKRSYGHF
jgi:hypothetical protein